METEAIDRSWVRHCFVTDCVTGERMTIDESIRREVDNAHIRASLRELVQRGIDYRQKYGGYVPDPEKLAKWAASVVRRSNFSPEWLAIGDEPGAAVSRAELMDILHRLAVEQAVYAIAKNRATKVQGSERRSVPARTSARPSNRNSRAGDLTIQQLAEALGNATQVGRRWRALCPSPTHDDRHPSLDIEAGNSQPIIFTCRAGCSNAQVIEGMRARGLWPVDIARRLAHG